MNKNSMTRGVIFIHSSPKALCPHIQWTISSILDTEIKLQWGRQPIDQKMFRTEYSWIGTNQTGAKLASALRGWEHLRYEITQEPTVQAEGARWMHTPDLGIHYCQMDKYGNNLIPENIIRKAISKQNDKNLMIKELELALGTAWDEELEPFRYGIENSNLRWLHHTE